MNAPDEPADPSVESPDGLAVASLAVLPFAAAGTSLAFPCDSESAREIAAVCGFPVSDAQLRAFLLAPEPWHFTRPPYDRVRGERWEACHVVELIEFVKELRTIGQRAVALTLADIEALYRLSAGLDSQEDFLAKTSDRYGSAERSLAKQKSTLLQRAADILNAADEPAAEA